MYFIVRGEIQIQGTDKQPLFMLGTGDFFGEESIFNNKPRSYGALALVETHLLTLSRNNLFRDESNFTNSPFEKRNGSLRIRSLENLEDSPQGNCLKWREYYILVAFLNSL